MWISAHPPLSLPLFGHLASSKYTYLVSEKVYLT